MKTIETDVLVVGAGPVGMTLALTLQKFGARVIVVDKELNTARYPRAAVVWPRTLEVLDLLGIAGGWGVKGVPLHNFTITIDGDSASLNTGGLASQYPYPLGIGQDYTEELLDAALRASDADYRRGVEVSRLQITDAGVHATLRTEGQEAAEVHAAWVVGCEGSHSMVRQQAGIGYTGDRNAGVQLVQGDVRLRGSLALEPHHGYLWTGGDHVAMFVMPVRQDEHYRVLATLPDDGAQDDPSLDLLQEQTRRFIPDAVLSDPIWLNRYRTQHRLADTYRAGRAFVAGDAAHVWLPVGGQGMNIGIQDAFNLGWKLGMVIKGNLPETALDTYEGERRPIGARNIKDTLRLYGAILQTRTLRDSALRWLIPNLLGFAAVSQRVVARFSQVDFHYDANLLIASDHGGSGIGTGERAPDAFVALVETGETLRLFDLYRTGRWQAFGWVLDPEEAPQVQRSLSLNGAANVDAYILDATHEGLTNSSILPVLRDMTRRAASVFGVTGAGIHLIRPDGVIAYRGASSQGIAEVVQKFCGMTS